MYQSFASFLQGCELGRGCFCPGSSYGLAWGSSFLILLGITVLLRPFSSWNSLQILVLFLMRSLVVLLLSLEQGAFVSVGNLRSVRWQILLQRLASQKFQYMDRLAFLMTFWKHLLKWIYKQLLLFIPNCAISPRLCHHQRQSFCLSRRSRKLRHGLFSGSGAGGYRESFLGVRSGSFGSVRAQPRVPARTRIADVLSDPPPPRPMSGGKLSRPGLAFSPPPKPCPNRASAEATHCRVPTGPHSQVLTSSGASYPTMGPSALASSDAESNDSVKGVPAASSFFLPLQSRSGQASTRRTESKDSSFVTQQSVRAAMSLRAAALWDTLVGIFLAISPVLQQAHQAVRSLIVFFSLSVNRHACGIANLCCVSGKFSRSCVGISVEVSNCSCSWMLLRSWPGNLQARLLLQ